MFYFIPSIWQLQSCISCISCTKDGIIEILTKVSKNNTLPWYSEYPALILRISGFDTPNIKVEYKSYTPYWCRKSRKSKKIPHCILLEVNLYFTWSKMPVYFIQSIWLLQLLLLPLRASIFWLFLSEFLLYEFLHPTFLGIGDSVHLSEVALLWT